LSQETKESLSELALLSIENEHTRMINIAKIIDVSAEEKDIKTVMPGRSFK